MKLLSGPGEIFFLMVMTGDRDFSAYWCWNPDCSDYGLTGLGNIILKERKGNKRTALLRCKTCNTCFSETRGTMFFGLHTAEDVVLRTLALLPEKGGIRGVARATSHGRNTITLWIKVASKHAKEVNDYFLRE